jgi:hypothetical protein
MIPLIHAIQANDTNTIEQEPIQQTQGKEDESKQKLINDAFITLLSPHIDKTVKEYYSKYNISKSFGLYGVEINDIKRLREGSYIFRVIVQVETYVGAHNPPWGLETITFLISSGGVSLEEFKHQEL